MATAAVGLAASILTFTTVAAKLSTAAATLYRGYRSIKDAPSDLQRVETRLNDLEFILAQINRTRSANPESVGDPATESYWASKESKLRSDFIEFEHFTAQLTANIGREFEHFTAQLTANIGRAKSRMKWLLSHEGRAKKVLGLLAEDIDMLRALHEIMQA